MSNQVPQEPTAIDGGWRNLPTRELLGRLFFFNHRLVRPCTRPNRKPNPGHVFITDARGREFLGQASLNSLEPARKILGLILDEFKRLDRDQVAQGMVEYLLILALVAFAATAAGMTQLASSLNSGFTAIGSIVGSYIT